MAKMFNRKKLSVALKQALEDSKEIEKDRRYRHDPFACHDLEGRKCLVDLAGSVMAIRLGVPPIMQTEPCFFESSYQKMLDALSYCEIGDWSQALYTIGVTDGPLRKKIEEEIAGLPEYDVDRVEYYEIMNKAVKVLKKHGL
jgi:hypothetical protein